jgi:hypothetical protein
LEGERQTATLLRGRVELQLARGELRTATPPLPGTCKCPASMLEEPQHTVPLVMSSRSRRRCGSSCAAIVRPGSCTTLGNAGMQIGGMGHGQMRALRSHQCVGTAFTQTHTHTHIRDEHRDPCCETRVEGRETQRTYSLSAARNRAHVRLFFCVCTHVRFQDGCL